MSFSAVVDVDTLDAYFDALSAVADECKVHLGEDGLRTRVVDPANVAMSDVTASPDDFESYDTDGGTIGLSISRIQDILGFGDSGDLVHLELDEETRKLNIDISGLSYQMALIDPESIRQEPDIPDLDLEADVRMPVGDIERGISATDLVSDHIRFQADPDAGEVHIVGEGDTDDVNLTLDSETLLEGSTIDGEADSLFSLDYLQDLKSVFASGSEVRLQVGAEMPMMLDYTDSDGAIDVNYMLAPRIQSE